MKIHIVNFLFFVGLAGVQAQQLSVRTFLGFSKSAIDFNGTNAPSLGKLGRELNSGFNKSLSPGILLSYKTKKKISLLLGYHYLECGHGWRLTPTNGNYTTVEGYTSSRLNQYFIAFDYSFDLLFNNKSDKQEKKIGWVYDSGEKWLKVNVGIAPALNIMNTPKENLVSHFLPLPATNNDNPEFVWMLGYETPRYVHKTSMGLWFRTGLTFVKKGRDKLSLDFVMNIGLQDKYIIETNNKYGNTRTGQLLKEEQFNVVSKGTSMALMLSYPIYFGKRK